jgi:tetratricopeptide (TPR) repeat protein
MNKAAIANPSSAEGHGYAAALLNELSEPAQSAIRFRRALAFSPADAEILNNYAVLLQPLRELEDARRVSVRASVLFPEYPDPFNNLGLVSQELGESLSAIELYERAIALKPDYAEAINNLGSAKWSNGEIAAAFNAFEVARRIKPSYLAAAHNLCKALHELQQPSDAIAAYRELICLWPDFFEAYWHMSLAYLVQGDYGRAWPLYEFRWYVEQSDQLGMRGPLDTLWVGDDPPGSRTILVYHEQGLGDTLQFCRYARVLNEQRLRVILRVPDSLVRLLRGQACFGTVIGYSEAMPQFDLHCPMMSLPLVLQTTIDTIPFGREAYLQALPADVDRWRVWLDNAAGVAGSPPLSRRLRIGVVWSGGEHPQNRSFLKVNARRNIPLATFAAALDLPDIDFVSLQKGEVAEAELRGREKDYWRQGRMFNPAADIRDFADTAGLIANLDLVISVDTSTAHLSAALGKPTWILNRFDTCWRWLIDRVDSPWYSSVTLYRQSADRDWAPVLSRLARDVRQLVDARRERMARLQ